MMKPLIRYTTKKELHVFCQHNNIRERYSVAASGTDTQILHRNI